MGWKEEPNPLLAVAGEDELNTSASTSTKGAAFCVVDAVEGDAKPSKSAL